MLVPYKSPAICHVPGPAKEKGIKDINVVHEMISAKVFDGTSWGS